MIKRNILYSKGEVIGKHKLDIVYDENKSGLPVIFFIHGGSWMSGGKEMYTLLGEHFSLLGYVTVVINYRLYPTTTIKGMVEDCREAIEWTIEHIEAFGGDANKIITMGHSAGGHLAAVTGLNAGGNIKGIILIDAFGLTAYHFLTQHGMWIPEFLSEIFGKEEELWKKVSPDQLLKDTTPEMLVLSGGNTYPFLLYDNHQFIDAIRSTGKEVTHITYPGKSHMQMIRMFETRESKVYQEIDEWIRKYCQKTNV